MQSPFTRFFSVALIALTLTGAIFITESSAQWVRYTTPIVVNDSAGFYPGVYPEYAVWRPFGGLFAGIHTGVRHLLCPRCWHSPCWCVTPMVCDPCWTPCFDPCDSCCSTCGIEMDHCGCSTPFGNFNQPVSRSGGTPSPTGFGTVRPSDGIPGQPPVGTQGNQKPQLPQSDYTMPWNYSPNSSTISTPPVNRSYPDSPPFNVPPAGEPTIAPVPDDSSKTNFLDLDSRLPPVPSRDTVVPRTFDFETGTGLQNPYPNPTTTISPQNPSTPYPNTPSGTEESVNQLRMDLGSGLISVNVPENARVFVNGYETKMAGTNRRFVVNDLVPGNRYDYDVRVVAVVNGQTVDETQRVTLTGGQQTVLAFGKAQQPSFGSPNTYIAAKPAQ